MKQGSAEGASSSRRKADDMIFENGVYDGTQSI